MDDKEYRIQTGTSGKDTISMTLVYIRDHCTEDISLADVAGTAWISPSYFSRLFARTTGTHFSLYLRRCRLEKARELLKSTTLSVTETAAETGFRSAAYFIKLFSAEYGLTPGEYRRRESLTD